MGDCYRGKHGDSSFRYQQGNGHRYVRHCQHFSGPRYDEVLEGQAYHSEETGRRSFVIVIRAYAYARAPLRSDARR